MEFCSTVKRNDLFDRSTEQFRKLFIGGLNHKTDEDRLKEFFCQWGSIVDVVVMKDKRSGRSRGFGFVTYRDSRSVDEAQMNRPHEIDGKIVETKRAMSREDANNPESHMTVCKLFVGGLKKDVTADDLRHYFSRFGNVLQSEIVVWRETGESRGFGFVTFDDYDPVDKAVLYKPHMIGSSRSDVKKALSKDQINEIRRRGYEMQSDMYQQNFPPMDMFNDEYLLGLKSLLTKLMPAMNDWYGNQIDDFSAQSPEFNFDKEKSMNQQNTSPIINHNKAS